MVPSAALLLLLVAAPLTGSRKARSLAEVSAALSSCAQARPAPGRTAQDAFLGACSQMLLKPGCQAAFRQAQTSGEASARRLLEGCARAYCPELREPRPSLCQVTGWTGLSPLEVFELWAEFSSEALDHDTGYQLPAELKLLAYEASLPLREELKVASARGRAPKLAVTADGAWVRIVLSRFDGVAVEEWRAGPGTLSQETLGAIVAATERARREATPEGRVVRLLSAKEIRFGLLKQLLKALGEKKLEIHFAVAPGQLY
jgi:hypothetical protein